MAEFVRLYQTAGERISAKYFDCLGEAHAARNSEYRAAIKIQAAYRGRIQRQQMCCMRTATVNLQRLWRGHNGRIHAKEVQVESMKQQREALYNRTAVLVQALFRGYLSRKYINNFAARRQFLRNAEKMMENAGNEYRESQAIELEQKREKHESKTMVKSLRRNHYLVGTFNAPGVCSKEVEVSVESDDGNIEQKQVNLDSLLRQAGQMQAREALQSTKKKSSGRHTRPTSSRKQPQGPFKPTDVVERIRENPLHLSLRAESPYDENIRVVDRSQDLRVGERDFLPAPPLGEPAPVSSVHVEALTAAQLDRTTPEPNKKIVRPFVAPRPSKGILFSDMDPETNPFFTT